MPNIQDRQALGTEEQREAPMQGPFGGIQTEVPLSMVSELGFAAASNICFRLGRAIARPGILPQTTMGTYIAGTQLTGFTQFYVGAGAIQVGFKGQPGGGDGGVYQLTGGNIWTLVAGSGGLSPALHIAKGVLAGKLAYSDGTTPIRLFDGTTITNPSSAPQAQAIAELALHLVTGIVTTYNWSGVGDPSDWTTFSAGSNNYLSDIGPIIGILKLGQIGYGFHVSGIIQIVPTGLGTAPFAFLPLESTNKGCISQGLLCKFELGGIDCAVYASVGNIQLFNQTQSIGIGDAPVNGRMRQGARQAIMTDIYNNRNATLGGLAIQHASGYDMVVTENMKGVPFKALWMLAQDILWCYNLDEENWTRFVLGTPVSTDTTSIYGGLGIIDWDAGTQGSGQAELWPSLALGKGNTTYQMDLSIPCEQSMFLTSGKLLFQDPRHMNTIKKFRLRFTDNGPITYTLTITNEKGHAQTKTVTLGSNSGDDLSYIFSFSIPGLRFQYNISAPAGSPFAVIELTPIYDIGGEQRGGLIDN